LSCWKLVSGWLHLFGDGGHADSGANSPLLVRNCSASANAATAEFARRLRNQLVCCALQVE